MSCVSFRKISRYVLGFLVLSLIPLFAQNGVIQGTIVDPQGGTIPNASVTATDASKGVVVRQTTSGGDGSFQLQPLPPGSYTITAESAGMKKLDRPGIVLDVNQTLNLGQIKMEVGATTEAITVEATTPLVESTTSNKSFVINSTQVTETSTNGRDFQSLMRTLPGVVSNDSSDFRLAFNNTDAFHVNGLRGSNNNVFLDGSINTDVGANDGQYTQLSLDAVGEFKVQTSTFNAEYGRNAGVMISATTKSGGQQFHGTLYEFLRNDAMDANYFFNNLQGKGKSPLRFNQFGGNLGGPLYIPKISPWDNKKLFFFFNYEGTRASRPNGSSFYDVPAPALLTGDFSSALRPGTSLNGSSFPVGTVFEPGTIVRNNQGQAIGGIPYPGNRVPQSQFSGQYAAFTKLLSSAYRPGLTQTPNSPDLVRVPFQDTYRFDKDQKALRVDYNISSKANAFFRWVDDAQQESQGYGIFSGNSFPVLPEFREKPGASWSWNLINTFSPTTTNEFIFTYNHLTQQVNITGNTPPSTYQLSDLGFTFQQLYPNSNISNRIPNISAGNFTVSVFPPTWQSEAKTFAWTDNFTKVIGNHTLKTGVFIDMNTAGQQPSWTDAPNVNFNPNQQMLLDTNNGVANMLLGNYYSVTQSNGKFFGSFKFYQTEAYLQDSWKASRKLTLEYGIRWAYLGPTFTYGKYLQNYWDPTLYNPAQAVAINTQSGLTNSAIIPNSGNPYNGLVQEGKGIPSGFAQHRFNNWAPRFGFAYDPTGSGRTAIRGGAGVFYERVRQNTNSFDALGNPPLSYTPTLYNGNIDNLNPSLVSSGPLFPVNITSFNKEGKIPTTYSWSLGVQHQLTSNMALDISYVGNATAHLQYQYDYNQLPLGTTVNTPILTNVNRTTAAARPYKGYNNINFTDYGANSNYNALQIQLTRRFTKDIMISANYTWSKALDIIDVDNSPILYSYDRKREYGPADFDRTHVFTVNYVYTLPTLQNHNSFVKHTLGGWELTGITRFWSGTPFSVLAPGADPGTLDGGGYGTKVRADYIGGNVYPAQKTWQQWFNPYAFARPLDGTLGTTGRNILRGPGINNWDISLFKNFNVTERVKFQLRGETFNTFNHTQLGGGTNDGLNNNNQIFPGGPGQTVTPGSSGTVGTAGQITTSRDPRTIQVALKFLF
jgi:hypothetical protein